MTDGHDLDCYDVAARALLNLRSDETKEQDARVDRATAEIDRLRAAGENLISAIEKQLAAHGKGIEKSERVSEAISKFRGL